MLNKDKAIDFMMKRVAEVVVASEAKDATIKQLRDNEAIRWGELREIRGQLNNLQREIISLKAERDSYSDFHTALVRLVDGNL